MVPNAAADFPAADFERRADIRILHAINRLFARSYHRLTVLEPPRLPARGPAIVMSNHISALDPLLIQSAVDRPIVWMMASEYMTIGPLKPIFERIRIIPVSRDGRDSAALRSALRALRDGHVLGVFPEGRIETGDELLPLQDGLALMAHRARAAVHPVYLTGSSRRMSMKRAVLLPQRVCLRFGAPIVAPSGTGATQALAAALESLKRTTDAAKGY